LYEFTYEKAKQYSPTLQKFLKKYPQVGFHVENLFQEIKAIGKHAGGLLVVPDAEGCLPIIRIRGVDQSPITEGITAQHLQDFGLVKFDVLGLATLRIIHKCIETVLKKQGTKSPTMDDVWRFYNENLHPDVMDPADQNVFKKVYHEGNFPSIFQFSEKGVQSFARKAKPTHVNDISAITALWRPGPLKSRANERYLWADEPDKIAETKREHPILQSVLGETRHLLLYQESFMQLAHELAGFTLAEADNLRKLLVKPSTTNAEQIKAERKEYRDKFISGCIDKGLLKKRAEKLWDEEIIGFISYGFNKSHSQAYAYNSYQCSWLYTYHEEAWIKACLEYDPDLEKSINTARMLGFDISKPDINKSLVAEWNVSNGICVPAFTSLKGVGKTAASELVRYRPASGFKDINEFFFDRDYWRWSKLNRKSLIAMVRMESFNDLGCVGPNKLFKNYAHMERAIFGETVVTKKDKAITYSNFELIKKGKLSLAEAALGTDENDWLTVEKMNHQKEIIGFYDKGLIVGNFLKTFQEFDIDAIDETPDELSKHNIWAVVEDVTEKITKAGKPFLVVRTSGMTEKPYIFRVWNTSKDATKDWIEGNVLTFSLNFSSEWGYNVPRGSQILRINK